MCAAAAERPGPSRAGDLLTIVPLDEIPGVKLIGEVDISNRQQLTEALEFYLHQADDIYLELGELSFIDVGGVSVLVNIAERLSPTRRLVLQHPPRVLLRIVELAWSEPTPLSMVDT